MRIYAKDISADTQVEVGECYLLGANIYHTTDTSLDVYEGTAATAANLKIKVATTDEQQSNSIMFPKPGIKCNGIYADWTAGDGTVYYAK